MKQKGFKFVLGGALFLFFGLSSICFGAFPTSQLISSASTTSATDYDKLQAVYQHFGTGFTGDFSYLDIYAIADYSTPTSTPLRVSFIKNFGVSGQQDFTPYLDSSCLVNDATSVYTSKTKVSSNFSYYKINGAGCYSKEETPISLNATSTYSVYISRLGGLGFQVYGSPDNVYANSCQRDGTGCPSVADLYFKIESDDNRVEITTPENGTSTRDFSSFVVNYNLSSTTATTNLVCVEYIADYETEEHTDCKNIGAGTSSNTSLSITKTFPYSYLGTIYARATLRGTTHTDLYNYTTEYLATSSQIYWTNTGESYDSFYGEPNATSTISESTINCEGYGVVGNSLCYVFKFLFVPAPTVLSAWSGLWETISAKPPIGYFSLFVSEISGMNTSSTPAYSMADVSDIEFFQVLRVGIGTLFSLILLFYVIHRFKTVKI